MNTNAVKRYYIPKLAVRLVKEQGLITTVPKIIKNPEDAYRILQPVFDELTVEHFVVMLLNTKNHVLGIQCIFQTVVNCSKIKGAFFPFRVCLS